MKKKLSLLLAVIMIAALFLPSCSKGKNNADYPEDFQAFLDVLDTDFSSEVNKTISEQGDDPALGFRSSGSPAEKATAEYLEKTMKEIGLQNVTIDETTHDGWTFKGANITFKNADGEEQKIDLGGYQSTIQAKDETIPVVYLNKGTAEDYKNVDVKGKLVLIDIDQNEDWWINTPAYQAYVKGAKCILANSAMPVEMGDRIGTQDMCGPAYAPALGISQDDTDSLISAIKASGKDEINVTFNADSKVTHKVKSPNVWGEIPGKTDEVIYMMAHLDGYFHSYFDDASGCGLILGTAKAMLDSEYKPNKTIRFICHGSEEWGYENSQADWAIGSFQQLTKVHPEWAEKAFAVVNIDGAYCVEGETTYGISVCEELTDYVSDIADPMIEKTSYTYRYQTPQSTYKEDFNYAALGVPTLATAKGEETIFYDTGYHTSADSRDVMGFDEDTWLWMHTLFSRFVFEFDDTPVKPLNFAARLEALQKSYDDSIVNDEELSEIIDKAIQAANPVTEKINKLNADYAAAIADGDTKTADAIADEAYELNKMLWKTFKEIQDTLLYLDSDFSVIFPHEARQDNIANLRSAISSLKEGNATEAYEEYLSCVGNGWEAMYFDKETVSFADETFEDGIKNTWAQNKVDIYNCDVQNVVRSLMKKADNKETDFSYEIKALKQEESKQLQLLDKAIEKEKSGLKEITKTLNNMFK